MIDNNSDNQLKIKKGVWVNGKRQEWRDDISNQELQEQIQMYDHIVGRKKEIENDINIIENTMKQIVMQ